MIKGVLDIALAPECCPALQLATATILASPIGEISDFTPRTRGFNPTSCFE